MTPFIRVDKCRHFSFSFENSVRVNQTTRRHVPKEAYRNEIIFDGYRLRTDVANVGGKFVQMFIVCANPPPTRPSKEICEKELCTKLYGVLHHYLTSARIMPSS